MARSSGPLGGVGGLGDPYDYGVLRHRGNAGRGEPVCYTVNDGACAMESGACRFLGPLFVVFGPDSRALVTILTGAGPSISMDRIIRLRQRSQLRYATKLIQ